VDATDLDADPLRQLATWLDAARAAGQPMPEAMTIASASSDAVPSAASTAVGCVTPGDTVRPGSRYRVSGCGQWLRWSSEIQGACSSTMRRVA